MRQLRIHRLNHTLLALTDQLVPRHCAGCSLALLPEERHLCPNCLAQLPRTGYGAHPTSNEVFRRFAGLAPVSQAASGYFYQPNSRMQCAIYQLKYAYRPALGVFLGRLLAHELGETIAKGAAALVPVPLHPKRRRLRGYNQSEQLAKGLSLSWGIPVRTDLVVRRVATATQTQRSRTERFVAMATAFQAISNPPSSLVVVDDVVTTGATLAGVLQALASAGTTELRVVSLAVTQ